MKLSDFLKELDTNGVENNSSKLQVILKILKKINSSLVLEDVLELVVKNAINITNCDRGFIVLKNEKGELENVLSLNASGERIKIDITNISQSIINDVYNIGQSKFIEAALKAPEKVSESIVNLELQTIFCAPLITEGETIGVIYVDSRALNKIESREITEIFEIFASQAGIAINNALLHGRKNRANSELKRAYNDLEIARREADKFEQLKNHFLTQMSHEIRTPFNIIQSSLFLLKSMLEDYKDPQINDVLAMLEDGSNRIIRTVDRILEMAKVKSGYYEISLEELHLSNDILQNIIPKYETTAHEKGIYLVYQSTAENDFVRGDKFMLEVILQEIIDNAVKFTQKGTVRIKDFTNQEGKLCVSIQDTGVGIDPEYLDDIFNYFTQEEVGPARNFEGSGLALALVKKYAELNNISLHVVSEKYKGSTFTLTFN